MKKTIVAIVALTMTVPVLAMPTKQQLAQAQPLVNDLTADDLRALKAKEKTPKEVAAVHLDLADKADTEAGKYLLLQARGVPSLCSQRRLRRGRRYAPAHARRDRRSSSGGGRGDREQGDAARGGY